MKERMSELNNSINWKPKSTGEGRFGKWLENLQDWNLSRSRYWGIPLPIWRNEDGTQEICIGSIEELGQEIEKANKALGLSQDVPQDLHRPYIDDVILVDADGTAMKRELDLIDVWFDSGSMPYAQWHYPFENKEKFERNFPADFIAEGVDQTRGWFYTLHAIGTMVFDSVAYKNVVSNGLVQDKVGRKMSKRLGNAVNPFETLEKYGADATRWYMISNAQPWDNLKFDLEGINETRRKFFGTLYNTYGFFSLYANIDGFDYSQKQVPLNERPEIDRWVISLLNTLKKEVDACYADYDATTATRKIFEFVNDNLSNWYVRLCRRRFWKGELTTDKIAAYQTLYDCLLAVSKMMAPVAPFFADWLYKNLNEATQKESFISVHLTDYPEAEESYIDKALEERMAYAQRISSLILSLRKKEKIRVRQPLQKVMIPILDENFKTQVEGVADLILSEVNIKSIEYLTDTSGVLKKKIKPNFKTLGRRLGKDMGSASKIISQFDQDTIAAIEQAGKYDLKIEDRTYDLSLADFEIVTADIPGWLVASDGNITTALDITITDELKAEGMARELVNRIQNIRKSSDFNVTDKIIVKLQDNAAVTNSISKFGDLVAAEVLATEIKIEAGLNEGESVQLPDDINIYIKVVKA
jgi:isoleucyl-tRNA synthetase